MAMTASDVLRALIAVYPPDGASWKRNGSFDGESYQPVHHVRSRAFTPAASPLLLLLRSVPRAKPTRTMYSGRGLPRTGEGAIESKCYLLSLSPVYPSPADRPSSRFLCC